MFRINVLSLIGLGLLLPCLACDDPQAATPTDGGGVVNPTDGGQAVGTLPSFAPAGAILGQTVKAFNSQLSTWAVMEGNTVKEVSWTLPLTAVTTLEGTTFFSRVWTNLPPQAIAASAHTGFAYDYIPLGHAPIGVYTTPHWEFHVIYQDFAEVQAIDCSDATLPAPELVPPGHLVMPPPDNCFPGMGNHALDLTAPEFNKEKFSVTHLLVYYQGNGVFKGKGAHLTSFEPKVTNEVFRARKSFSIVIPPVPPNAIGRATLVPTKLEGVYKEKEDVFVMTLSNYVPAT